MTAGAVHAATGSKALFPNWVGKSFVFLPHSVGNDYFQFQVVKTPGVSVKSYEHSGGLIYSKFHNAIITCTAVKPESLVFHVPKYNIDLSYTLVTYTDNRRDPELDDMVSDVAPAGEMKTVKAAYLGQVVWTRGPTEFVYFYSPTRHDIDISRHPVIPIGLQLTITDVRWGDNWFRPVRIVGRDETGKYFCYEVAADPTNKVTKRSPQPITTADSVLSRTDPVGG